MKGCSIRSDKHLDITFELQVVECVPYCLEKLLIILPLPFFHLLVKKISVT